MKSKSILVYSASSLFVLSILFSFSYLNADNNRTAYAAVDTIFSLKDITNSKAVYKSPSGNFYEVTTRLSGSSGLDCSGDNFHGSDRRKAKTGIAEIGTDNYVSINELILTLPSDNEMKNHHPPVSRNEKSSRVFEEKRNAKIKYAYIYAIKRETDNDFHIIIGNVPDNHVYLNIENSGLPGSSSKYYKILKAVRKKFEDKFGELCNSEYFKFNPPLPVEVEGSLFYDIDHVPGGIGPAGLRPGTSWEIHPVTNVVFKD